MHHFPNGTAGDTGGDADDDGARDARVRPPRPEHPRLHRGEQGEDDRRERAASHQIRREAEDLKPLDDALGSAGDSVVARTSKPRVQLPKLYHRPPSDPRAYETGEHRDRQGTGTPIPVHREQSASDDCRRSPLRVARCAERQRLQREHLERSADQQAACGVA